MNTYEFVTHTFEETMLFAETLATKLSAGDVLTLEGDLGAGKTTFTKGLAKGLGVKRTVNSPTFTIIKEYKGSRLPLYHMDVYRLEESEEDLGFDEYFFGDGVTVVEWAKFIKDQLPKEYIEITIQHNGDSTRKITLQPNNERYVSICEELMEQ
ncbi:tRNA (adenosine(37)-N6)-threonylcarbamoyltransferase complex ATPase subunit type 1 TsaE [Bacillus solimangrovi]|uniref:tRNA threonylcarbamoyladenosine biosynthesis protein TsaE n=1 Tax=Bacillus solimangrovi TaxID=1305675 RepID=A0A1E5LCC3_9BACI|nr:tRNA (adenosine(37)-N6)-threonylcarbamoyltransferase complex ATPase subunit type 1 TsaE [Bacillus solimangrovi]OEH91723.1 tRNA (adenosine(37)-N6)-threonylcarbamoyltransferase complex ATPase subunit type 1 TsaE [Bacillus solimangrovi]